MKIAIPVEDKSLNSNICSSFGRSPYFLIYDTENKTGDFIKNDAATSTGGAGIKAAQIIADNKAGALLTPRCGKNAADVLTGGGVKLYKTKGPSINENIEGFLSGKLALLDEIHPGFHKHG